jgi:hypothetical protein
MTGQPTAWENAVVRFGELPEVTVSAGLGLGFVHPGIAERCKS